MSLILLRLLLMLWSIFYQNKARICIKSMTTNHHFLFRMRDGDRFAIMCLLYQINVMYHKFWKASSCWIRNIRYDDVYKIGILFTLEEKHFRYNKIYALDLRNIEVKLIFRAWQGPRSSKKIKIINNGKTKTSTYF